MIDARNHEPSQGPPPDERLAAYVACLAATKDRRAVREVVEREVLLCLIRTNSDRINEYPLLETQQRSIIEIVAARGAVDPLHGHIRKLVGEFVALLGQYAKPGAGDSSQLRTRLMNTETQLLKCVQGVVYTTALCTDNFIETLVRAYGEEALGPSDAVTESTELDEQYWRKHFEHFVVRMVDEAYDAIMTQEAFTLSKERSLLVIRYPFDALLERLCRTPKPLDKTRVQTLFEFETRDFASRKARKLVHDILQGMAARPDYPFASSDIDFISQIVCIDPAAREMEKLQTLLLSGGLTGDATGDAPGDAPGTEGGTPPSPATPAPSPPEVNAEQVQFLREQVVGMACSVATTLNLLREDFLRALDGFSPKETAIVRRTLGDFSLPCLGRALQSLLEFQFVTLLRRRAGEDMGKIHIRTRKERRTSVAAVETLFDSGLTRIRRNKLWQPDPGRATMQLFRPQTATELESLLHLLQIEPQLAREIGSLWTDASFRVEFALYISLDLLSRSTTNLNQRLAELLSRFGITRL
ncbi:hypothetical protein FVW20_05750 [Desulfovibrio oxamicus]|uniref:DNA-directed RNA polymerase III subunit RPC3 n=1 Tax=Nitratidesulfovibrio oxamicus TaxID=32016 RepID=A0ABS0J286_9BACT|nr:hypothetical protein [Nitratidesulfovibrio oxamicus]MBG3876543.1 hypothetical protein [Nitratidesulfovibrio oxamicus]